MRSEEKLKKKIDLIIDAFDRADIPIEKINTRKFGNYLKTQRNQLYSAGVVKGEDTTELTGWMLKSWSKRKNKGLSPSSFTTNSSKSVWWKCPKCGHEYMVSISSKAKAKSPCPACAVRAASKPVCCLDTGECFESRRAAARHMNPNDTSHGSSICRAVRDGSKAYGFHWAELKKMRHKID